MPYYKESQDMRLHRTNSDSLFFADTERTYAAVSKICLCPQGPGQRLRQAKR